MQRVTTSLNIALKFFLSLELILPANIFVTLIISMDNYCGLKKLVKVDCFCLAEEEEEWWYRWKIIS